MPRCRLSPARRSSASHPKTASTTQWCWPLLHVFGGFAFYFVKMPCFSRSWKKQRETRPIISIKKWSKFAVAKCPSQGWKQGCSRGSQMWHYLLWMQRDCLCLRCSKLFYSDSANISAKQHVYANFQTTGVWIPTNFTQLQKSSNAVSDHSFFVNGK